MFSNEDVGLLFKAVGWTGMAIFLIFLACEAWNTSAEMKRVRDEQRRKRGLLVYERRVDKLGAPTIAQGSHTERPGSLRHSPPHAGRDGAR